MLVLATGGCQGDEIVPTQTMVTASPRPTLPIGVDFATATRDSITRSPVDAQSAPTEASATETPTATPATYLVQAGDTLVGIAAARGVSLAEILALNPDVQPELLLVGQVIVVPPGSAEPPLEVAVANDGPPTLVIAGLMTYPAAAGGTWVLGEVRNSGLQAIELTEVRVVLITAEGGPIGTETVWVTPATVNSQAQAPFGVLFSETDAEGAAAEAEVVAGRPVFELGNRFLDLAVIDAEVTIGHTPIRVSGQIENQGQVAAGQISIVTTFYDANGVVTGFHELALDEVIGPGERRPFTFISLPPGGRADRFAFAVQAVVAP
jgi:LysM repeat protein